MNLRKIIQKGRERHSLDRYSRDINSILKRNDKIRGLDSIDRVLAQMLDQKRGYRRIRDGS